MKKTILWIAAILMAAGCAQKKTEEKTVLGLGTQYYLFPENLKGKVKEMHETNFWATEQDGKFTKGAPMTWKDLDSVGSLKNTIEYFDESGSVVKEENIDENNTVRYRMVKSSPDKWERFRADTSYSYIKPELSAAGVLTGLKIYRTGKDTLVQAQVLSYDGNGFLTKLEFFNYKNEKAGTQELTTNKEGLLTNVRFLNGKDSLVQSIAQKFDDNGFMTEQNVDVVKPAEKIIWKFTPLKFDDHGNWTMEVQDVDNGKFRFITERTYVYY
ncbi:MAG TPA: hypothetical protein VK207_01985 [Bacteroidales bacterium]|nr:hypothetical protein [Bacteroidales bacterium]